MRRIHVDIVMANKLISHAEARRVTAALERQVQGELAAAWNVTADVHPAWFETWRKRGSAQFDQRKALNRPFQIAKGGYASFYDARRRKWVNEGGGRETPTLTPDFGYANRGGSRKSLRAIPRPLWKKSRG